jgi:proteasome accessory factor PafA2
LTEEVGSSRHVKAPNSRLFGLETEYGIQVDGVEEMDVVVESMELIRCYLREDFVALWDYDLENPRKDMRGFEVENLLNDKDETLHLQRDRKRQIPLKELKSDLIISNGARLYNDHTHPEYSTPECYQLDDLLASDRAGERILLQCAKRHTEMRDSGTVRLYKNNTDFDGHSYGCHENYLLSRDLPFDRVIEGLLPFLVTRQIFAGAGKVGVEADGAERDSAIFQLAQRSDFIECIASVDTMTKRPLVNTRDEPHANASEFRRLHIIIGDANMCEHATDLKVGSMLLALDMLDLDLLPRFVLADPVGAVKSISRDQTYCWSVELDNGTRTNAVEIQRAYLDRARGLAAGRDAQTDRVLEHWSSSLDSLERNPDELIGRCDWVTKKWMLESFATAEGLDWNDPDDRAWLQSQDLEYHNIDPQEGLYLMMEQGEPDQRLTIEAEVVKAMVRAPQGTRAYFRGLSLEKFGSQVRSINWDSIEFNLNGGIVTLDLKPCVDRVVAAYFIRALEQAESVQSLVSSIQQLIPTLKSTPLKEN